MKIVYTGETVSYTHLHMSFSPLRRRVSPGASIGIGIRRGVSAMGLLGSRLWMVSAPVLHTFFRNLFQKPGGHTAVSYTHLDFLSPTVMMYRPPLSSLNMAGNVAYTLLLCLAVILLMGWLFDERVRKEFEHG